MRSDSIKDKIQIIVIVVGRPTDFYIHPLGSSGSTNVKHFTCHPSYFALTNFASFQEWRIRTKGSRPIYFEEIALALKRRLIRTTISSCDEAEVEKKFISSLNSIFYSYWF
jgi:hypothetical protein